MQSFFSERMLQFKHDFLGVRIRTRGSAFHAGQSSRPAREKGWGWTFTFTADPLLLAVLSPQISQVSSAFRPISPATQTNQNFQSSDQPLARLPFPLLRPTMSQESEKKRPWVVLPRMYPPHLDRREKNSHPIFF
jgi:hypothetical protein